jgi:thioredoxin-like negative regulator of GroEL
VVQLSDITVVQFTHPLCSDCHELEQRLAAGKRPLVLVDVSRRPDLARRYHVTLVPTAFVVAGDGRVLERLT